MNEPTDRSLRTAFVRTVTGSRAEVDALADAAERRGALGVYTSSTTIDVAFDRPLVALRYAVFARDEFDGARISAHLGRFLDADRRGIASSRGPSHAILVALAEAARASQILMTDAFFERLGSSKKSAFAANSSDLGNVRLEPGLQPVQIHALSSEKVDRHAIGDTDLPAYIDPFFGREQALSTLTSRLDRHRILTITGPPGIGKTRIAVEFARRLRSRQRELDIAYVDLNHSDSLEEVVAAIAGALGIPLITAHGDDPLVTLGRAIAGRGKTVVVLDGADASAGRTAVCLQTLLPMAPTSRWLVTSRVPLNLVPEYEIPLDGLRHSSAIRLLHAHRQQAGRGLNLDERQVEDAASIARLLDGSPLAVRVAAGLVSVGPLERVRDRLREVLDADHQRTRVQGVVRAALDDLGPADRRALTLLALPRAPLPSELALEMGEEVEIALEHRIPELHRRGLIEKSRRSRAGGAAFLQVPDAIRHEVESALEASVQRVALNAFVRTYVSRGAILADEALGTDQIAALDQIEAERIALRRATRMSANVPEVSALETASALQRWYATRGPRREGRAVLEEVLERSDESPPGARAELSVGLAELDRQVGAGDAADRHLRRAERLAADAGSHDVLAEVLAHRHALLRTVPDAEQTDARDLLERAEDAANESGDKRATALVHLEALRTLRTREHSSEARAALERAERAADQVAQPALVGSVRRESALLACENYRFERARTMFEEALERTRDVGSPPELVETLVGAARTAQYLEDADRADRWLEEAVHRARRTGELERIAGVQLEAGKARTVQLEFETAREELLDLLDATEEYFWPRLRGPARLYLAASQAALGRDETARHSFERAETELDNLDEPAWERAVELLREMLSVAAVEHGRSEPAALRPVQQKVANVAEQTAEGETEVIEALRLVDRYLAHVERGAGRDSGDSTRPTRPTLLADTDGHWFRAPGSDRVDISNRHAPRLMFRRFVLQRRHFPGTPLPVEILAEIGWPDEELSAETAKNRVYDAVSTLRNLGLRELLETQKSGYLLRPGVALRAVTDDGP